MADQVDSDILLSETSEGILRLTLNDQKRRNALSETMLAQLSDTFAQAALDPAVRVIVLAANGPAFCAGHDLKEITAVCASVGGTTHFIVEQESYQGQTPLAAVKQDLAILKSWGY